MLTPEEIAGRRFLVSLRGYDRDEVHAFLSELAGEVGQLQQRNAELARASDKVKAELQQLQEAGVADQRLSDDASAAAEAESAAEKPPRRFAGVGDETQRILDAAQEAGNQITRKARHDADRELQAARQRAAKVIADGERRRDAVEELVARLEERRTAVAGELRGVRRTIEEAIAELVPDEEAPTVRDALTATVERRAAGPQRTGPERPAGPKADGGQHGLCAPQPGEPPDPGGAAAGAARSEAAGERAGADLQAAAAAPTGSASATAARGDGDLETARDGEPQTTTALDVPAAREVTAAPAGERPSRGEVEGGRAQEPGAPGALRAQALEPLHPKMVRRVKRRLSDLQNIALDRLRRAGEHADADALAITDEELAALWEVGEEFLGRAHEAGTRAAAVLAGQSLATPGPARPLAAWFAEDAGARVREPLAATLRMGLGSGESGSDLNERIGAVFSELKSAAADELSATHLIKSYELGLLDAWAAGGIDQRTWVLGREPRCPEGRCRHNDRSGAVGVNEPFPSGHKVPPVHVGCTCTTVPVLES